MTILKVEKGEGDQLKVEFPANHPKADWIMKSLENISPGYVEYVLQFGQEPHCSACRDTECENVGMGDDACRGFKFGEEW